MASTRRLEIFHDPQSSEEINISPGVSSSFVAPLDPNLHPTVDDIAARNITFVPPIANLTGRSPLKLAGPKGNLLPKALLVYQPVVPLASPQLTPFDTDSPSKRVLSSAFQPIAPQKPEKVGESSLHMVRSADKENFNHGYHNDNFAEFPDPNRSYKAPPNRALVEAAPLSDRQHKKARLEPRIELKSELNYEKRIVTNIPEPHQMPLIEDKDGSKPPYSYASLIGMSILRAPNRRLTLAQIYKWISDTFSYYRASDTGWQNSIRHNLSLNKAFIKQERPKDDPGKGNYWAIESGMEPQFVKDKPTRRPTSSTESNIATGPSVRLFPQLSSEGNLSSWPSDGTLTNKPTKMVPDVQEPSSDATIPASDALSHTDELDEARDILPPGSRPSLSSPPQMIHSSPPVATCLQNKGNTSPVAFDFPLPTSCLAMGKRKLAAMDDSGYFSSLNSSASRPYETSDVSFIGVNGDRKRTKRGRAEEEIARIRSSSHDISPTKDRCLMKQLLPPLVSSSPLRHFDSPMMLPPLTPAVTLKVPPKPPASISPNTNLRNHRNKIRELVGSPVKSFSILDDEIPFSPVFGNVDDVDVAFNDEFGLGFDILADNHENNQSLHSLTSPEKYSARRPYLDRISRSSHILTDITGTDSNRKALVSPINMPFPDSPIQRQSGRSPTAFGGDLIDQKREDLFGLDLLVEDLADDELEDASGLDILQGFQKIGGNRNQLASSKKASRPPLEVQSNTSRF